MLAHACGPPCLSDKKLPAEIHHTADTAARGVYLPNNQGAIPPTSPLSPPFCLP